MQNNARARIVEWIEGKTGEKDVPALTWLLQRVAWGLMRCYPSATHEDNSEMILRQVRTVLGGEGER